jgi:hypothetical protein
MPLCTVRIEQPAAVPPCVLDFAGLLAGRFTAHADERSA